MVISIIPPKKCSVRTFFSFFTLKSQRIYFHPSKFTVTYMCIPEEEQRWHPTIFNLPINTLSITNGHNFFSNVKPQLKESRHIQHLIFKIYITLHSLSEENPRICLKLWEKRQFNLEWWTTTLTFLLCLTIQPSLCHKHDCLVNNPIFAIKYSKKNRS